MSKKIKYGLLQSIMSLGMVLLFSTTAWANHIQNSIIFKGGQKFLNDLAPALTVLGLLAAVAAIGMHAIRKMTADEMDSKMWDKRIAGTIKATILLLGAGAIVAIVKAYFQ